MLFTNQGNEGNKGSNCWISSNSKSTELGNSLVVQWLRLCASTGVGPGSIPGWGTKNPQAMLFSHSVMSNSLRPHGLQHALLPCPSPSPRARLNSCPLRHWYYPIISPPAVPFSSCLQSFPASGSFLTCQLFASGGQNIGASASASVIPMNIQGWFPLGLTDLVSLQSKGLARIFSNTAVQKHQFLSVSLLYGPTLTSIHDYWKRHSQKKKIKKYFELSRWTQAVGHQCGHIGAQLQMQFFLYGFCLKTQIVFVS